MAEAKKKVVREGGKGRGCGDVGGDGVVGLGAQEVVKFVEPLAGRKRGREEGGRGGEGDGGRKQRREESQRSISLAEARQDVLKLGASVFEGRLQKKWESQALASAGVEIKHVIKMPLPMLVRMRKKQQEREAKRKEEERVADVVHGVSGPKYMHGAKKASAEKLRERRRKERSKAGMSSLDPDNLRKGVLHVRSKQARNNS
jgi:Domain of unknown function (DUF4602)